MQINRPSLELAVTISYLKVIYSHIHQETFNGAHGHIQLIFVSLLGDICQKSHVKSKASVFYVELHVRFK